MRTHSPSRLLLLTLIAIAGCAQLQKDKPIAVTTSGPHSVLRGQTVQLSAATAQATDPSYTWASDDSAIATVDDTGLVTGVAAGETSISATGAKSGVVGHHPMVVIDPASMTPDGGIDPAQVPYYLAWAGSAHADLTAEAFNHWNAEGSVPVACARCHSSEGYIDYIGGDGSAPGRVDSPGKIKSLVRCETCHDSAASKLTSVSLPSGVVLSGLGAQARCIVCHQGRASGLDVDAQIADAGVVGEDTVSAALSFTNVHYFPAAATLFAGQANGGYQYAGQTYDTRFRHVPGFDTCNGCHDPHSTAVRFEACATCHVGVKDVATARDIRQIASRNQDYDGDGNRTEGIAFEIDGLRETLLKSVQQYGAEKAQRLCYENTYPYWFGDLDGNGACSSTEAVPANRYTKWTPRLQKAAYNYQLSKVDPGNFAHNAKYVIQLLHDSIVSMNGGLVVPLDVSRMIRNDPGHFNGSSDAARHWDEAETVQASCSRCHGGAEGYRFFVQYGVGKTVLETDNGLECSTCHDTFAPDYTVMTPAKVFLPDNTTVVLPGKDNLCANCHIGRASKSTIDQSIALGGALRFINVHNLPAAGVREGTLTKIGYEYTFKTYAGRLTHVGGVQCTSCHDAAATNHTFLIADVWAQRCETCHADASRADEVRLIHLADYDGDGNVTESLGAELDGMAARLMVAMRGATANGLCYEPLTYPYFFKDTDTNGTCSVSEAVAANAFAPFTPALLQASHNYQLSRKDPGAFAHNFEYVGQLLFDSVENITGATPTNLVRP